MSEHEQPFALDELPARAPWWPWSPWSTGQKIRNGEMTAIREGRRVWVTEALLRRYLEERAQKAPSPYRLSDEQKAKRRDARTVGKSQP
jgi:hypothetical protein